MASWHVHNLAFFSAFILWNNLALTNLQSPLRAVFRLFPTRTQASRCGNTFAFATAIFLLSNCTVHFYYF
jgi:hypothetical protein